MKTNEGVDVNQTAVHESFSTKKWFLYMMLPTIIMLVLTVLVLKGSLYRADESVVNYSETGDIDYKVYLKENNFYKDKYLGKDMQYVAGLIDKVNVNFQYKMHTDTNLDFSYKYNVKADLIITDPTDENKVLYKKTTTLIKDKKVNGNMSDYLISDSVNINYDEYNSYVNSYKKEYALSVKSKLILTLDVVSVGSSKILKEDFKENNQLLLAIPLSEQTINIGIDTSNINTKGTLERNYLSQIKKPIVLVLGLLVGILSLILLYISLYTLFTSKSKIDIYKSIVDKILKEYDRAIVMSKSINSIAEDNYRVLEVDNFDELLDAHDATEEPILYNEIIPNQISKFIIVSDQILYKYVINRNKLEQEEAIRISERNKRMNDLIEKFNIIGQIKNLFSHKNNISDIDN